MVEFKFKAPVRIFAERGLMRRNDEETTKKHSSSDDSTTRLRPEVTATQYIQRKLYSDNNVLRPNRFVDLFTFAALKMVETCVNMWTKKTAVFWLYLTV
jgi:hypothetical protein